MASLEVLLFLVVAAFFAGFGGSFLGIGGGVFLVPFMTLVLNVDIRIAIAVSLIGVIATSSGAASVYVRDHLANLRLAMFLEVATTLGAIAGALVGLVAPSAFLFFLFAVAVLYAALVMVRTKETARDRARRLAEEHPLSERLGLGSVYYDQEDQGVYRYRISRPVAGFAVSVAAGGFSGLLGVGGGFIKVPAMNLLMRVPMKAAVATSNFTIGVTAAASAFIYYSAGFVDPGLAAMVIVGVFSGANLGTRLMIRTSAQRIRFLFAIFLVVLGFFMGLRAFGGEVAL